MPISAMPTPRTITVSVKTCPPVDKGLTSRNPTVVIVMMVM